MNPKKALSGCYESSYHPTDLRATQAQTVPTIFSRPSASNKSSKNETAKLSRFKHASNAHEARFKKKNLKLKFFNKLSAKK